MVSDLKQEATRQGIEKLAYTAAEFEALTGLSAVTRWRLEKRGLLKAVPGIRVKLYSRKAVEAFLDGRQA